MSAPALWTTDAMATAMRAQRQGALPQAISGLSIDSRSVGPGEAFFAITGDNRDGHDFVTQALAAKAALAVVAADRRAQFPADAPLLIVPDVLAALRNLAAAARARFQGKVIGVTGSVGKTGTKEALRLALSKDGETHASIASYNNHWGVPLSLARCPATARYAVFEMGMNHEGEIAPLTRLVRPHIAIITTIAPVHLEFLGTLTKIADAKAEIFLRHRAGRRGDPQPRHRPVQPSQAPRQRGGRCPHRLVRRAQERRRAPDQMRAACALLDGRGANPRRRSHLQDRCAGPAPRQQFARGLGGGRTRRRRSRARSAGARRAQPGLRPRRAD